MKATKTICAALVLTAMMVSCTREAEINDAISTERELVFTAGWADNSEEDSRTVLQANGTSIWWTVSEEINLFVGKDVSAKFISTNTQPQHIVSFAGNVMIGYPEDDEAFPGYWAVYPYNKDNSCDGNSVCLEVNSTQTAAEGTFADKSFPAVARSVNFSLAFWNVCGGARFSVVTEGVKRVVFRSNDGSPMAGKVKVGFGADGKPQILEIAEPVDSVVLDAPEGGFLPGVNYFASMIPRTHESGLSVTLWTRSQRAIRKGSSSVTIRRSAFGKLDNVDGGLIYTDAEFPEDKMVDLGLSVKWATCNVGASSPEEYGDYFAWGETEPKEDYSWSNYKWGENDSTRLTKYCNYYRYGFNGFTDNKKVLDPEDDAATNKWGGKWRTPTYNEFYELYTECTWEWTTLNGVYGSKVTSNKEGYTNNWIFLPAAGYHYYGTSLAGAGSSGCYWSSSLYHDNSYYAYCVFCGLDYVNWFDYYRYVGLSIRPVYGERAKEDPDPDLGPQELTLSASEIYCTSETQLQTLKLKATIDWEIIGYDDTIRSWLNINPEYGMASAEERTIYINVLANEGDSRSATITFYGNVLHKQQVTITQEGLSSVKWGSVNYKVKKLADGNIWFVENLRYVPEGKSVTTDLTALDNGVWYPVDCVAKALTENADTVAKKGYLYSAEAALGVAAGTVNDDNCLSYEGAQGICPPGWHLPTLDEIANLVGRVALSKYDLNQYPGPIVTAPYWSQELYSSTIPLANADGFNITYTTGFINANATATKATVIYTMSYILSSTAYFKSTEEKPQGFFNKQFYCIMPALAGAAKTYGGSCNGGPFNYRGGANVRCIKTKLNGTPL